MAKFRTQAPIPTSVKRGKLLSIAIKALRDDDWKFEIDDEREILRASVQGKNSALNMIFQAKEDKERFLIYTMCPIKIPEGKRMDIAHFLSRANYGLELGNFELDMNDGEVRYKVSIDVEGGELTPKQVNTMLSAGASTMDNYFPGFMGICYAGQDPKPAVEEIEKKMLLAAISAAQAQSR